jgi:hypothetical protein
MIVVSDFTYLMPVSPKIFFTNATSFKTRRGVYLTLPIQCRSRPRVFSPTRLPERQNWVCILLCPSEPGLAQKFPRVSCECGFLQVTNGCVSDSAHPMPVLRKRFLANVISFKKRLGVYLTLPIRTQSLPRVSLPM